MEVSRRDFLRLSVAAGSGTALAGLIGSGVNLGPTVARAQELRIKGAKTTPSLCPYCSVGCGVILYGLGDKSKFLGAHAKLRDHLNKHLAEQPVRGFARIRRHDAGAASAEMYQIDFPGLPIPVQPTYAVAGDWLIIF